jgi:hypothetical protein
MCPVWIARVARLCASRRHRHESASMSTTWQCCAKRSTSATTQAAPGIAAVYRRIVPEDGLQRPHGSRMVLGVAERVDSPSALVPVGAL